MREQSQRSRIRLELTPRQKAQIREATGRDVNALELGLQPLTELAEFPRREEEKTG
jgi:hypothetical protein